MRPAEDSISTALRIAPRNVEALLERGILRQVLRLAQRRCALFALGIGLFRVFIALIAIVYLVIAKPF